MKQFNRMSIYVRGFRTSFAATLSRVMNLLSGLIAAPILIAYTDSEMFGYWLTVTSVLGVLILADFGIGSALVNWLSSRQSENHPQDVNVAITSAYVSLGCIGIVLLFVLISWSSRVDVSGLLKLSPEVDKVELRSMLIVAVIIFCLNIPLNLVSQVQLGFQQAYIAEYFRIVGYLLSIVFLFGATHYKLPIHIVLLGYSGFPVIVNFVNLMFYLYYGSPSLSFKITYFDWKVVLRLARTGSVFLLINVANIIGTNLDNAIIAANIGATEVAGFAISKQMYSILYFVVFLASPFWPAFSEAMAARNKVWIKGALLRLTIVTTIPTVVVSGCLYLWGREIISIWISDGIAPDQDLLLAFSVFWIVSGVVQPTIYLLQVGEFKFILLSLTCLFGICAVIIKSVFAARLGVVGIVWTNALAYLTLFVVPAFVIVYKKLR